MLMTLTMASSTSLSVELLATTSHLIIVHYTSPKTQFKIPYDETFMSSNKNVKNTTFC